MKKTFTKKSMKQQPVDSFEVDLPKQQRFLQEVANKPLEKRTNKIKWGLLSLVVITAVATMAITNIGWSYVRSFENAAGDRAISIASRVLSGIKQNVFESNDRFNILLLGLDEIANQREGSKLTDSIILISIHKSGEISLLSLPRDLWIDSLKTKINALYYYGEESDYTNGVGLVNRVVEEITGVEVNDALVLKLETVKQVIDILGGIEVEVEKPFTDTKFPRDDVNLSTANMDELYETISFEAGRQNFDGETALKYIRSRNSQDEIEGNDLARSRRQQQVINSLIKRIQTKEVLTNPDELGRLYAVWKNLETSLTIEKLASMGRELIKKPITISSVQIPVVDEQKSGIIYNPPVQKYGQWVYAPIDPSWEEFREFVLQALNP